MKVKKIIVRTTEHDIDITGATLFTIEEAKKLPEKSREYNRWWWLKSSCGFDSYHSSCVYTDGFISDFGEYVNYNLRQKNHYLRNFSQMKINYCHLKKEMYFFIS